MKNIFYFGIFVPKKATFFHPQSFVLRLKQKVRRITDSSDQP